MARGFCAKSKSVENKMRLENGGNHLSDGAVGEDVVERTVHCCWRMYTTGTTTLTYARAATICIMANRDVVVLQNSNTEMDKVEEFFRSLAFPGTEFRSFHFRNNR